MGYIYALNSTWPITYQTVGFYHHTDKNQVPGPNVYNNLET